MSEIKVEQRIVGSLEAVFNTSLDLRGCPEWSSQITRMEVLTDGPIGPGTRFRETRKMYGKECTEEMEVTSVDAPRSYTVECTNHGCHYKTVFTFRVDGEETVVCMSFSATPLTLSAKVIGGLMAPMMKGSMIKCLKGDLTDLKNKMEESAVPQPG